MPLRRLCTFSNHPEQAFSLLCYPHAFHTFYAPFLVSKGISLGNTCMEHIIDFINHPHVQMQPSTLIYPILFFAQEPCLSQATLPFIHFHHHISIWPFRTISHDKIKYLHGKHYCVRGRDREWSFTVAWIPGDHLDCVLLLAHVYFKPGRQGYLLQPTLQILSAHHNILDQHGVLGDGQQTRRQNGDIEPPSEAKQWSYSAAPIR